jgi:hypothetical protein
MADKTTKCKRCGSIQVGWVQSKKTGKWYLAFATPTHSMQIDGKSYGSTGYHVHAHVPHKCDDPARGGFKPCDACGRHHITPLGAPAAVLAEWCTRYADAPKGA